MIFASVVENIFDRHFVCCYEDGQKKNLLDIGAGDGRLQDIFREFFDTIDCIEID